MPQSSLFQTDAGSRRRPGSVEWTWQGRRRSRRGLGVAAPPPPLLINPYRGCEFGCCYCFGRKGAGEEWFESRIIVKSGSPAALERLLASGRAAGRRVVLGAETDPYQPAEAAYGISRKLLRVLARRFDLTISVLTKSDLILRDTELLREAGLRNRLRVEFSFSSMNDRLSGLMEPGAAAPITRLGALRRLSELGIQAGAAIRPIIPGLTDSLADLEKAVRAAREHRARFLEFGVLSLQQTPPDLLLSRIREIDSGAAARLEHIYAGQAEAPTDRKRLIATRVIELKRKYGFEASGGLGIPPRAPALRERSSQVPSARNQRLGQVAPRPECWGSLEEAQTRRPALRVVE